MFRINFSLLEFGRTIGGQNQHKDLVVFDRSITANKNIEGQLTYWGPSKLFALEIDTHWWGSDHAGLRFSVELLGIYLSFSLYDGRHWNYDAGRWYKPGEEAELYEYDQLGV